MRLRDLTGLRFGRLVALEPAIAHVSGRRQWLCRCDCGEFATVKAKDLRSGGTRSCGCLRRELALAMLRTLGARRSEERRRAIEVAA